MRRPFSDHTTMNRFYFDTSSSLSDSDSGSGFTLHTPSHSQSPARHFLELLRPIPRHFSPPCAAGASTRSVYLENELVELISRAYFGLAGLTGAWEGEDGIIMDLKVGCWSNRDVQRS